MDPAEYERMYNLEETYWWFQGRKHIVAGILSRLPLAPHAGARVLDMGCGTGLMLEHLGKRFWAVGLDFSNLALLFTSRRGVQRLIRADVENLPIQSQAFDIITALDLAEHVERDDLLLKGILHALKPGGYLVLTAPAYPFLWSEHDEALHHFRRYTSKDLQAKIQRAGFQVERLTGCISFTLVPIVLFRLLQKLRYDSNSKPKTHLIKLPRWANWLMFASVKIEGFLLRWINIPFGVTLLAVARKAPMPSPRLTLANSASRLD